MFGVIMFLKGMDAKYKCLQTPSLSFIVCKYVSRGCRQKEKKAMCRLESEQREISIIYKKNYKFKVGWKE